jgi:hypothetical protein
MVGLLAVLGWPGNRGPASLCLTEISISIMFSRDGKIRAPLGGAVSEQHTSASAISLTALRYSMGDEHTTRKPML